MFRRELALYALGVACLAMTGLGIMWSMKPGMLTSALPLAVSMLLLTMLWAHGTVRSRARRRELERSFADLAVLHHGTRYQIAHAPLIGEYPTRRHAAQAALDRGGWAVIVRAWDRYFVLACRPVTTVDSERVTPVSFRSRAVADVVPAIRDDVARGA